MSALSAFDPVGTTFRTVQEGGSTRRLRKSANRNPESVAKARPLQNEKVSDQGHLHGLTNIKDTRRRNSADTVDTA